MSTRFDGERAAQDTDAATPVMGVDPSYHQERAKWHAKRQLDGQAAAEPSSDVFLLPRDVLQLAIDTVIDRKHAASQRVTEAGRHRDGVIRSLTQADNDLRIAKEEMHRAELASIHLEQAMADDNRRWLDASAQVAGPACHDAS